MKPRPAFSLAEAVIAIFVLTAGFVVVVRLFSAAIRYAGQVSSHATAHLLAHRRLEEIRGWNQANHRPAGTACDFDQWPGIDNADVTYPESPGFVVHSEVRVPGSGGTPPFYSPCSLFEQVYPPSAPADPTFQQPKLLNGAIRRVVVSVRDPGGTLLARLDSLVGLPQVLGQHNDTWWSQHFTVDVQFRGSAAATLARDQSTELQAQLLDAASGQPIPGVVFNWIVAGSTWGTSSQGFGAVAQARDGSWCRFSNQFPLGSTNTYGPGPCYVWATTSFQGHFLAGHGPLLTNL